MRKRCLDMVYNLAQKNDKVVFIGSDIGANTLNNFKREFPDRFIMEGISEQHTIGMAAGLALNGKIVYINTIASFLTRRCFEQNVLNLGLYNANVRLLGSGGGLVYAPLGPTHLAPDDIAIMRTIPNMTILVPTDADEMERAMIASETHQGPIYIRMAKGFGDPIISKDEHGFKIGKAIVHMEPKDVLLISCGIMTHRSLSVAESLNKQGIKTGVINVHTLKPFDDKTVLENICKSRFVFTVEEHYINGGLGSIVSEIIAENASNTNVIFKRFALPDSFTDKYGSQESLIKRYSLETDDIEKRIKECLTNHL